MNETLIAFGWVWFVLGIVSGAILGTGFARNDFWGGYDSWRRRLARLGHIACFGTGGLALAAGLTFHAVGPVFGQQVAGVGLLVGAISMPLVCFLSAWRKPWRVLFPLPVAALSIGVLGVTVGVCMQLLKG